MTGRTAASGETTYGWVVVFASLALHSVSLGAPTMLFVALKPIAADLETVRSVPSLAYSLMMVGAGVGGVAMGWWMDRLGVMQPVLFGSVMISLGALLASYAEGPWTLFVASGVLIGLFGKAAMIAPLVANVTRWFDRRRGLAVAILTSGQGLAGAIWPGIVQYFNELVGWRGTFLYFSALVAMTMVPLALLLRPRPPLMAAGGTHGIRVDETQGLDLSPRVLQGLLWFGGVFCCAAMAIPIVHLVSHATDLGHTLEQGARILSVLFIAGFVSRIAFGMLADRIGGVRTLLIGSACMAVMLFVFVFTTSYLGLLAAALLFGLGFSGIMPCYPLLIRLFFPVGEVGWRIAGQYLFSAFGMALGGWVGGVVFDVAGSYTPALVVGLGFNALNFFLIGIIFVRGRPTRLEPAPA
ncbi:MAG: MFS transporter [Immundisolibacterales bacterium]|nr:MFS transporter [Immundisolibacterales bacterium]